MKIVIYDHTCSLCRSLADFMAQRSENPFLFHSVEEFASLGLQELEPEEKAVLMLWDEDKLLLDRAAWSAIVDYDPYFSRWNWLAERIGLSTPALGSLLRRGGNLLRKLCTKCPG